MDFFNDFVFNNYMIFDDAALDVFLSTGDITKQTYDAAKKNRANFLAQQQQNIDNQATEPQQ